MEKGGLLAALTAAGVHATTVLAWGDEMRVGLCSQVRRVWAPRGVKVRQPVSWRREWRSLALAVDGRRGRLTWTWMATMQADAIAEAVQHWQRAGVEAVVWDRARSHGAPPVRQVGVTLISQPPAAPELNPAERVFEELRRAIEGTVYPTIEAKVQAVNQALAALSADPKRVKRLTGWRWIRKAWAQLPQNMVVS